MKTKIFLDSGDPAETRQAIELLGYLDGQTTNPSLVAKNPEVVARINSGQKYTKEEIYGMYKSVAMEVSGLIPSGSVSLEVYADAWSSADDLFEEGQMLNTWIPNAHIKYPLTAAGLDAAKKSLDAGIRVNMTLCFSQEQAAAVHAMSKGCEKGDVFISPFIGRLDDIGQNGLDLVKNIIMMYKEVDSNVLVLAASIRSVDHFAKCIEMGADIITSPLKVIREWVEKGKPETSAATSQFTPIIYEIYDLEKKYTSYNIQNGLTDAGIEKFSKDWKNLIQ